MIQIKVSTLEHSYYFQVGELAQENLTTLVRNLTPFELQLKSKLNRQEPAQVVSARGQLHYALCYPNKGGSVSEIRFLNEDGQTVCLELDFMLVNTAEPKYFESGNRDLLIKTTIGFFGEHKIVEIEYFPKALLAKRRLDYQMEEFSIRFALNLVGLSIMQLRENKPRIELMNITCQHVEGVFIVRDKSAMEFCGFVSDLQIDNNSTIKTNFPVILRKSKRHTPKNSTEENFLEWRVTFEDPSKSTHLYLNEFSVSLCKMEAYLEEEYLDQVLDFTTEVYDSIVKDVSKNKVDYMKKKYYDDFHGVPDGFRLDLLFWQNATLDKNNNFVYIDRLNLPVIRCSLSYFQDASSTIDKDFDMVSLIGVAVGGFEEAPIKIEGIGYE